MAQPPRAPSPASALANRRSVLIDGTLASALLLLPKPALAEEEGIAAVEAAAVVEAAPAEAAEAAEAAAAAVESAAEAAAPASSSSAPVAASKGGRLVSARA